MEARKEDVSTIDGIIKAFYEIVSGPAGAARDWERDRTLCIDGVRFVRVAEGESKGVPKVSVMSLDDFVKLTEPILMKGFFEWEIHRITYAYGNIAHVMSTYISRQTEDGPIIARGVNSIQLFFDGNRWWIAGAIWQRETKDFPIPEIFLP
jgi:hypothetical protein